MKIIWHDDAKMGRTQVSGYIRERFGYKRVIKFRQEVGQITETLRQYPSLGSIDPLFTDSPKAYRSVVVGGLSKMVYLVDEKDIHIVAFWDCRQEPEVQAAQVKR